tara:strand:- start:15836 stop:16681 length:846 start_codon:yes stop_codon:yes gene_type:complete
MNVKQFNRSIDIQEYLDGLRKNGMSIGFVPTMGALHKGHASLIQKAKEENDLVICSIFVNPLQFNRKEDLENYPNRTKEDISLLNEFECDILFLPSPEELYQEKPDLNYDFGSIAVGMEADFRPGHFQGVAAVIERFFTILNPDRAYFGEKDYQQLAIVKWLVNLKGFSTQVVGCPTIRFENGLAMSSRNFNLSQEELETASLIYQLMNYCKQHKEEKTPIQLMEHGLKQLKNDFKTEYFQIVDEDTLKPIESWEDTERPRVFVAAYLSTVRLIDNMSLID